MSIIPLNKLLDLSGKTAIVTGAVGIGFGIFYRLSEAGANVVIASKDEQEAKDSARKIIGKGFRAKAVKTDVSVEREVVRMVDESV